MPSIQYPEPRAEDPESSPTCINPSITLILSMNFEEKHPAEIQFREMIEEVNDILEKYKDKFLDGDEKEALRSALEPAFV